MITPLAGTCSVWRWTS